MTAPDVPLGSKPDPIGQLSSAYRRLALIADVHGNAPALAACLADVGQVGVDAVAYLGCLTWGPEPRAVVELARSVEVPVHFLRGNGERAVLELAAGHREPNGPVDEWMVTAHGSELVESLGTWPGSITGTVGRDRSIRLCHGSPRSDIELLTPDTSADRLDEACAGIAESTVAHGHTHLQYHREVGGRTVIGVGSVGLPYGGEGFGARWTFVGESIDQRTAPYDFELAVGRARAVGYPGATRYEQFLRNPPSVDAIVADAESRRFSD